MVLNVEYHAARDDALIASRWGLFGFATVASGQVDQQRADAEARRELEDFAAYLRQKHAAKKAT